jgi:hypothetical protein
MYVALLTNIPYIVSGYVYDLHVILHRQASNGALVITKLIATEHFLYHILQQYDVKTKHCTSFRGPVQSAGDLKVSGVSGVPASTRSCAFHAVTDSR